MARTGARETRKKVKTLPAKSLTARREKAVKGGTNPSNDKRSRWMSVTDGTSNTVFF